MAAIICAWLLRVREVREKPKTGTEGQEEWGVGGGGGRSAVSVFCGVAARRCPEITGRRRLLTFAVHHAVVFVVLRSLPSHIQQPPGAGAQHHRDRALRLLDGDR